MFLQCQQEQLFGFFKFLMHRYFVIIKLNESVATEYYVTFNVKYSLKFSSGDDL